MAADVELQNAINKAAAELKGKIAGDGGTPPVDNTDPNVEVETSGTETETESETETETETTETTEGELSESELDESKRLYLALRDPKMRGPILAALAAQAGVNLTTESKSSEVKEAKKSITKAVEEALGDEYKFLAPKLGKAFEAALQIQAEENEAQLSEIRTQQIERDVTTAYEKLSRETKGESKKLEAKMATLSEEIPIGTMTVEKYIRRLYSLAVTESQQSSARKVADKIRKNAGDAPSRLRSGSQAGTEPKIPDKKMGLKESVEFAIGELTKGR